MEGVHITRSRRKSIELSIDDNLQIAVKAPLWVTDRAIDHFIAQKADWISRQKAAKAAYLQAHPPLTEAEVEALRRRAKAVNFGIVYGISDFGLARNLHISRKEAGDYISRYFERYPGVRAFMDKVVAEARETGYVTTMFGRRRELPAIKSRNFNQRMLAERMAMNTPIQGTAADVIKRAMIAAYHRLKEVGVKSRILLQVHDELVLEVVESELDVVQAILRESMEHVVELSVPLSIDIHWGRNWAEAK